MTRYNDDELRAIITYTESYRTERKRTWNPTVGKKAREAVCAFANDLPASGEAGVLIVGANDDGTPNPDFHLDDQILLSLTEMRTDGQIVPPPSLYVEARELLGHTYAVVVVEPSDSPPVRYRGTIWVRSGPKREIATAQDERILNEKRQHGDGPADLRLVKDVTWRDINEVRFRLAYLPKAFSAETLERNNRTDLQRLISLKLVGVDSPHYCTLAGCLSLVDEGFGHVYGAYIQWLRIDGNSIADDKIDAAQGGGHLQSAIETIDLRMSSYNRTEVDYGTTALERRFSTYPLEALKELLRNAVMHRDYWGSNAPVRVYWYNDRIEFINSGGPYGDVSVSNFGTPGITGYRNPNIAEAMRVLGLVQRFGSGIGIAQDLCRANGNPPIEFEVTQQFVRATVRPAKRPW